MGFALVSVVVLTKELREEELSNSHKEAARIAAVILALIAYIFSYASEQIMNWNKERERTENVSNRGF
jgi:uncharacterized membrane protein